MSRGMPTMHTQAGSRQVSASGRSSPMLSPVPTSSRLQMRPSASRFSGRRPTRTCASTPTRSTGPS
eukprot:3449980-Alexandrium_andersonii.AAC.1